MKCIAIEGLDGSGKTTVANELKVAYEIEGLKAQVVSPYRLANDEIGSDIYPLWKSEPGALLAVSVLKGVIDKATMEAESAEADVLIFDRHWMTALTEIEAKPKVLEAWDDTFVPAAYLKVDPLTAQSRAKNDQTASWMSTHNFNNYALRYAHLCQSYGKHLLGIYRNDDDVSINSIVRSIIWDMNILR